VQGQSENISIHRIVDRYLEHARVFLFYNNGQPEVYMGSADWMNRNLHSRIEVIFPILDEKLKAEIIRILQLQLGDTRKAVLFLADLSNEKIETQQGQPAFASQEAIYNFVKELK
jgi:polyphosphate kinase